VWLHHDDVRRANGLEGPSEVASLEQAVAFAVRYQRRALATAEVDWSLSNGDLVPWLAGPSEPQASSRPTPALLNHAGRAHRTAIPPRSVWE